MDLETQDAALVQEAVSKDSIVDDALENDNDSSLSSSPLETQNAPATTFSRLRQKRRFFGSSVLEKSNQVSPLDRDAPGADGSFLTEHELLQDDNDDGNGSGIFGTTQSVSESVGSSRLFKMTSDEPAEEEEEDIPSVVPPNVVASPRCPDDDEEEESTASSDEELEFVDTPPKKSKSISDSQDNEASVTKENEAGDEVEPKESSQHSSNGSVSSQDDDDDDKDVEMHSDGENDKENEGIMSGEEEADDTEKESSETPEEPSITENAAAEQEPTGETKKKVPDRQSLITSTDQLFLQVTDRQKVTVKDILSSLQTEYDCEKFDKESKAVVKDRLTALILGQVEPLQDSDSESSSSSEEEEVSESEASGAEADDSDFEGPARPRKKAARKKTPKKKKAATERRNRVKRKSAAAVKAAAVRVQAEQLRKKRLEELRVRNEELQLLHNREEQKRAAQIAAKLETDTEEMRLARLEQRLDLLEKLDKKRFAVIQEVPPAKVEKKEETAETQPTEEESEDESSEEEMELELVGKPSKPLVSLQLDAPISLLSWADRGIPVPVKKEPAKVVAKAAASDSNTDDFLSLFNTTKQKRASPGQSLNARAFLKKRLLSKQRRMGNQWLARELGYQNEKEHVEDCLKAENKKRLITLQLEQERIQANERKILRERWLKAEDEAELNDEDDDPEDEDYKEAEENQDDDAQVEDEDDEEMAMARELNQIEDGVTTEPSDSVEAQTVEKDEVLKTGEDESIPANAEGLAAEISRDSTSSLPVTVGEDAVTKSAEKEANGVDNEVVPTAVSEQMEDDGSKPESPVTEQEESMLSPDKDDDDSQSSVLQLETQPPLVPATEPEVPTETSIKAEGGNVVESEPEKPKGPRNSAWREMLKKEAERVKKLKKRKGEMIDDEADEEEEEEIVGLEDFGFAVHKKKKNGDDDNDVDEEFNEDDLENVVDDVSDGEGDEDAGEEARKAMEIREEKERHKEIMRRMREGYDGRRGGIAGGGAGARGVHRFDQLVAADNREDAKRLGLLNDDEMDSDDENEGTGGDDDEEEDETALLDKMLKDRFLHRSSVDLEENFSEDEGEDEDKEGKPDGEKNEDLEEKEQERMAKRFTKRARMQRLIEAHGHEEEFSQLRLMEEDSTLKEELQKMKNGLVRKRSQSNSLMSSERSHSGGSSTKRQKTGMSAFAPSTKGSSLAIALQASRRKQNRTSFLRDSSTASSETTASFQRSVGFKHVIFQSSNSRASSRGASQSQSSNLPVARNGGFSTSSSLWSNVSRGFQKRH